jgi:hypothetical protein
MRCGVTLCYSVLCRWSVCGGGAVGMYDETFAKKIPFFKLVNNNNK